MSKGSLSGKLAVILHADVADSTSLVRQDEQLAHSRIQETFQRLKTIIAGYRGRVHELRGDALLAEFERASDAVAAALAFQTAQDEYLAKLSDDIRTEVRIGIALGEVIIADATITGAGVVLAQRLEQLADRGKLVIQGAVYETIPERFPFEYEYLGDHRVKGFDEPVRAYRVEIKDGLPVPPPQDTGSEGKAYKRRNRIVSVAVTAMVAILVAVFWFEPWKARVDSASLENMVLPLPDKPSIAVLPFKNLGGEPGNDYLSEALNESVVTELSRFREFFVIARDAAVAYKDQPVSEVAENLGIRYIVKGSIQTVEGRVRVTAQLIDAVNGRHLWAERFDRDLENVLTLQDEISQTIVSTIGQSIDYTERERAASKLVAKLSAVELRMRARELFLKWNKEDLQASIPLAEKAIEIDPDYAIPYVHMAWVHIQNYRFDWLDTHTREESRELAVEWAEKAVELDPFNYETRWALGQALATAGQLDRAKAEYDRALELNPNSSDVLADSTEVLGYLGRAEEAIPRLQKAMRLNPKHPDWYHWQLGWALYLAERYEEALASIEKMGTMPNGARRTLAPILVRLGRMKEARAVMAEFLENEPGYSLEDMKVWPFRHKEYLERWTEDQRIAGVPELPPPELPEKPSIAVLPFTNLSGDSEQDYFVNGITEDIITELSRFKGLFVISSTSSFAYKGKNLKVQDIARELGVRYLLEGSVRRSGENLRITAQLIEAGTGAHIWAEKYDRQLTDVFTIQDKINSAIVTTLGETIWHAAAGETKRKLPSSFEAYDYELLAREALHRFTREDNLEARRLYEKALERDLEFAPAYKGLAWTYVLDHLTQWVTAGDETLDTALELTNRAAELEPNDAGVHRLLGRISQSRGRHNEALGQFERALELNPNDGDIIVNYGNALIYAGRTDEGIEWARKAMRRNPHHPDFYANILATGYYLNGRYEDVLHYMNRIEAPVMWDHELLAATYGQLGRQEEASKHVDAMLKINPDFVISSRAIPFKKSADVDRYLEGLRKAGLPE